MKSQDKPTLISIFFNEIVCFMQDGDIQITRLLDRKLRKKEGFFTSFL